MPEDRRHDVGNRLRESKMLFAVISRMALDQIAPSDGIGEDNAYTITVLADLGHRLCEEGIVIENEGEEGPRS